MLTGCGTDNPGDQSGSSGSLSSPPDATALVPDSCSLLNTEQIFAATGHEFAAGELDTEAGRADISLCVWTPPNGSELPVVYVHVADTDITIAEQREAANNYYGSTADVEVPGGVDAFVTAGGQHVGMEVGPYWVMVTLLEDSNTDLTQPTVELANVVAESLSAIKRP